MHSTHLRREAIHGLLVGTAFGEAVGLRRMSRCPSRRRKIARDREGRVWPRRGFYGADTQLMLIAAQAVLNSCSTPRGYQRAFSRRFAWYLLSLPVDMSLTTRGAATLSWLPFFGVSTGINSTENSALSRASYVALALNGTGHSLKRWIDGSTKITHTSPNAINACLALATLARIAANARQKGLEPIDVLGRVQSAIDEPSLKQKLAALTNHIGKRHSPRAVARSLGWKRRIPSNSEDTMVMACYCFLRYPNDYFRAINAASLLGGDRSTLCALVGGLVGANRGYKSLPEKVRRHYFPGPHGQNWMSAISERMSHWPHGAEDLNRAPALKSRPLSQLLRNLAQHVLRAAGFLLRLPLTILLLPFCLRR